MAKRGGAARAALWARRIATDAAGAPDFGQLHADCGAPGVTPWLLWQEYKAAQPEGWQYSVFCPVPALAGDTRAGTAAKPRARRKLFVDYAGQTVPIADRHTGKQREAQVFIGVLGCSDYTFAEATWSQQRPDWLGSHVRMLEHFGGVPAAIVPDNRKSGVQRPRRYEPDLNPS